MRIPLDRHDSIPLYQRIEGYLRQSILAGALAPATRLPAARQLADALMVSRITVENAYAALEADGLVERRSGSGTYVLAPDTLALPAQGADWPLWQHTAQAALEMEQAFAEREGRSVHPNPIAFTGFGDPRRFPLRDFAAAIKVVLERRDRVVPSRCIGLLLARWPVALWPAWRDMRGIANELQNIPLGDAEMFQQVPWRVGDVGWMGVYLGTRKCRDRLVEGHMGVAAAQLCQQLLTQHLIRAHRASSRLDAPQGAHLGEQDRLGIAHDGGIYRSLMLRPLYAIRRQMRERKQ